MIRAKKLLVKPTAIIVALLACSLSHAQSTWFNITAQSFGGDAQLKQAMVNKGFADDGCWENQNQQFVCISKQSSTLGPRELGMCREGWTLGPPDPRCPKGTFPEYHRFYYDYAHVYRLGRNAASGVLEVLGHFSCSHRKATSTWPLERCYGTGALPAYEAEPIIKDALRNKEIADLLKARGLMQ